MLLMDPNTGILATGNEFQDQSQRIVIKNGVQKAKLADILKVHDHHYI